MKWVVPIVLLSILFVIGFGLFSQYISATNEEVEVHNQYKAQLADNKNIFDNVWKTIQQVAGVPAQYAAGFEKIYTKIMDSRYKDDGNKLLFKWVQEQNPNYSPELHAKLMVTIEANRAKFERCQTKLIAIKQVHDNLREKFPTNIYLKIKGVKELKLVIVTSTKTEEAFATGIDDNIEIFPKETK